MLWCAQLDACIFLHSFIPGEPATPVLRINFINPGG
jgi:hypothetical protein